MRGKTFKRSALASLGTLCAGMIAVVVILTQMLKTVCACPSTESVFISVLGVSPSSPLASQQRAILARFPLGTSKAAIRAGTADLVSGTEQLQACKPAASDRVVCSVRTEAAYEGLYARGVRVEFGFAGGSLTSIEVERTRRLFGLEL